jgi:transaldolase
MLDWYGFETYLLAASIRDTKHFERVIAAGADVVTLPVTVFDNNF